MVISSTNHICLWCNQRLADRGFGAGNTDEGNLRARSREHIIPEVVFGKIITTDMCKDCNSFFGTVCDHAFVNDQRIVGAANLVGITVKDLWTAFQGFQHTQDGRAVKTVVKRGVFRPVAELKSLDHLSIPATEGQVYAADLKNLRARLLAKVRRKLLGLSDGQIEAEVDKLLTSVREDPQGRHYNHVIDEGFDSKPLDSRVVVTREMRPWETEWCLAKMVWELSRTVVFPEYQSYFRDVMGIVRSYLERRACSSDQKEGTGIFEYATLDPGCAEMCHRIYGRFDRDNYEWRLTFFGTAQWRFHKVVRPISSPEWRQEISIVNPTGSGDATLSSERFA